MAESSDRLSSLAARYAVYGRTQLKRDVENCPAALVADIRSLAASVLRQDETRGFRGLIPRMLGGRSPKKS